MGIELISPPDEAEILNIVSVAQLKANLRISNSKEDDLIKDCILSAYAWLDGREGWLNRCILTQTWRVTLPGFQESFIDRDGQRRWRNTDTIVLPLPLSPLQDVASISYLIDGDPVPLDVTAYRRVAGTLVGTIQRVPSIPWPSGLDQAPNAVQLLVTCGWGVGADVLTFARGIQRAILLLASDAFRNREDTYAEPRLVAVDRKIENGVVKFAGRYRIFNDHA